LTVRRAPEFPGARPGRTGGGPGEARRDAGSGPRRPADTDRRPALLRGGPGGARAVVGGPPGSACIEPAPGSRWPKPGGSAPTGVESAGLACGPPASSP